jgi:glycosyltransferase involved in cell wall biosynthesis
MRRLKILQVATHSDLTRGGAQQLYLLARELKRRDHCVSCAFHASSKDSEARDALRQIEQLGMPLYLFNMNHLRSLFRLRRLLLAQQSDVIHSHRDLALRFCYLATIGLRIGGFFTQRGTTYPIPRRSIARLAFRSRKIDRIIAVSEAVKQALITNDAIPSGKIEVVYGGVDETVFHPGIDGAPLRRELNIPDNAKIVGTIGALKEKKGHDYFFTAAAEVSTKIPDTLFVVAGGGKKERFTPLLQELHIADRVRFLGHRQDIERVIAALDLVVCASTKGEGLTGALREALAMAKPVVSTSVSGNPEIVIHNETGLLVPPRDSRALADAIVQMLTHPEQANALARRGYDLVQRLFLNSKRCDRIEQIYYDVLRSKHLLNEA